MMKIFIKVFINIVNYQKNYEVDVNLLNINYTILIFNNIKLNTLKNPIFLLEKKQG